ncbi:PhzF family phenazine biosynthesis protein [Amantichitinum ursilacus]|uniref:Trans-2,3-dihydro-3-hydroxyanthranilate isomerase n=1 Tax=Amantichitinum ursilacus TaxID=857265 RepID=A0A0N0XIX7_9NEIS|nr:PhzF family phenazine biosynthesis protein [Amantichitinum ursilacus]KPC53278.1 Trans-2,3-dihydro-3-hydroxyanthranilate isomerase [Amantichitinum ursilacus]
MPTYRYRIVNVFAQETFGGNPLAVFDQATGLNDGQMQKIAQQLNLSETTFVFAAEPGSAADVKVRIFTPGYELPFAGHPTLGTAWTIALSTQQTAVKLGLKAGDIPVDIDGDYATLTANAPVYRDAAPAADIAAALGTAPETLAGTPLFVDVGSEQLVVALKTPADVAACKPPLDLFVPATRTGQNRSVALVWAWANDHEIIARFFWVQAGAISEDFGTGSACANLGGWLLRNNAQLPLTATMIQGHGINRLAHLKLTLTAEGQIKVGGRIVPIGSGELTLD